MHKQIFPLLLMPLDNSPPACRVRECVQGGFERETTCSNDNWAASECSSPQTAHLLYCTGWRLGTRLPDGRCTTVTRWDSWRCQSRWCPAGRGRCPKSQCPSGPNTPPPPHTEHGKRDRERGKGHVSQTLRSEQNSQAVSFFWGKKIKSQQCKSRFVQQEPKKLEVPITAGDILGENPACVRHCRLLLSLRSQRICFLCNQSSMKHTLPNMGNGSVPLMTLPRPMFSVKFSAVLPLLETRA